MNKWLKPLRVLLFPFAVLYHGITRTRNFLFDIDFFKKKSPESVLILVGNLTVGGTGKTPHVEYLIRLLQDRFKVATLSRGYGRKTKGIIIAHQEVTAKEIADEPMQFYLKYGSKICVAVSESRVKAIPEIINAQPENQVILLDDAFQHRHILADFQIVLSDFNRPFYHDFLLPMGRLRESRKGIKRADAVIVSKCPTNLDVKQQQAIKKQIYRYANPKIPIFFTAIRYLEPIPLAEKFTTISTSILLVTGIAQTKTLVDKIQRDYQLIKHLKYSDHADYQLKKVEEIRNEYQKYQQKYPDLCILTTEKDAVKLKTPEFAFLWKEYPVFYLPIAVFFLAQQTGFDQLILNKVQETETKKRR